MIQRDNVEWKRPCPASEEKAGTGNWKVTESYNDELSSDSTETSVERGGFDVSESEDDLDDGKEDGNSPSATDVPDETKPPQQV